MGSQATEDIGKLIMRLALGILVLLHGIDKVQNGISFVEGVVADAGMPSFVAYGVYLGEVIAPLMVILGLYARIGALLIVANMLFALGLVHVDQLYMLNDFGGWQLELQGMFLFTAVALFLMGPGRISVNGR